MGYQKKQVQGNILTNIQKSIQETRGTSLHTTMPSVLFWREQSVGAGFSDASFPLQFSATCSTAQSAPCQAHL